MGYMLKDAIVRFDTHFTHVITSWPASLNTPMLVITNMGQPIVMSLLAGVVILIALQQSAMRIAFSLGFALVAMGANSLLKHFIHRTRPDTLYVSNMYFETSSFPSGHTFGSTVICGTLAILALKFLPAPWSFVIAGLLGLFIILVGISRVYVGAHYPTDVIAGWILGAAAVTIIMLVVKP